MAIKVVEIDLSNDLQPIWGCEGYDEIRILVRRNARLFGWCSIISNGKPAISTQQLRTAIEDWLGWDIITAMVALPPNNNEELYQLPPISVVVCTRERPEQLQQCVAALLELDYPNYDIIVVDNASPTSSTAEIAARYPIRYVREDRPGLDWARNRGIEASEHDIIAFTDDDATPDRYWLRAIAQAFLDPEVITVTGLVAPAELETPAQILFELGYGGMGKGLRRRRIKREYVSDRNLLWASSFGVGANMAFRRSIFADIGLFDVALDVGTPSGGGGDVEMFHRVVSHGHLLVYEPSMLVWHTHRRDIGSFRRLLFDNGRSFGAYLFTCARNRTIGRSSIIRFALLDWLGRWLLRNLYRRGLVPRRFLVLELLGALSSLRAYQNSRRQASFIEGDARFTLRSQKPEEFIP